MTKNIFSVCMILLAIIAAVFSYSHHPRSITGYVFSTKEHYALIDHACGELPMLETILVELTDDDITREGKKSTGVTKSVSNPVWTPDQTSLSSISRGKSSKSFIQIFPALYIFIRVLRI